MQPLPLDVVRAALQRALDDPARGGVPTGMITFASMSALRNVPFRVVCAIGLADGAFPTSARPSEFDLMQPRPRRGDRQRRVDERNVFLDLLLAARDVVHLSYAGRSVRDNSVLPPSVLVSELVEYLVPAIALALAPGDAATPARARLVVEHPLQPFAQAAFELASDPRVRSFNGEYADALRQSLESVVAHPLAADAPDDDWLDADDGDDRDASSSATTPFLSRPLPPPGAEWRDVPIDRLAAFFRNPCRFLLEKRLGIELRRDEDELQDDEPVLPDVHGRAPLVDLLLPRLLEGLPLDDARTLALAGTDVPMGGFGERFLERELNGLQDFATQVREFSRQPVLEPRAVECTFVIAGETWRVHAAFAELRSGGLLRHRYAKQGPRDYLDAWLPHLMLCVAAPSDVAFAATTGISRDGRWYLDECPDPLAALECLLGLYVRGLREPLSFFPKAAWAYLEEMTTQPVQGGSRLPSRLVRAVPIGGRGRRLPARVARPSQSVRAGRVRRVHRLRPRRVRPAARQPEVRLTAMRAPTPLDVFACPLGGIRQIEASAGTGKTWNICGLYLRLLIERRLAVQDILVVTFTNAATAELRERIRQRVVDTLAWLQPDRGGGMAASGDDFVPRLVATARDVHGIATSDIVATLVLALSTFDEASIFTIHGFCQRALADTPFTAQMPLALELVRDDGPWVHEEAAATTTGCAGSRPTISTPAWPGASRREQGLHPRASPSC